MMKMLHPGATAASMKTHIHTMSHLSALNDFEVALRAHIQSNFLKTLPPQYLKLRVSEFLQLTTMFHSAAAAGIVV